MEGWTKRHSRRWPQSARASKVCGPSAASLTALAEATGISLSTLSRLESGQRRPTLELLLPLARELRVDIGQLIGAPQTGDPRLHLQPVTCHGMTMLPLTRRAGSLQAYKLIISPKMRSPEPEQARHEGYWLYSPVVVLAQVL